MSARLLSDAELDGNGKPRLPCQPIFPWDNAGPFVHLGRIVERRVQLGEQLVVGRHLLAEICAAAGVVRLDDHQQLRRELERERARVVQLEEQLREASRHERDLAEVSARAESAEQLARILEMRLDEARAPRSEPLNIPVVSEAA